MFNEEPDGNPHGECAAETLRLNDHLNEAVGLLAKWCVAVADKGSLWDEDAERRPSILRDMIDAKMAEIREHYLLEVNSKAKKTT